jgi:nucleoside-diphosphate-sugar epimerase
LKVVVTGANGWLGRSSIWSLSQLENIESIIPVTRKSIEIIIENKTYSSIEYSDIKHIKGKIDGYIHLPFVTRDKVKDLALSNYVQQNTQIIEQAKQNLELHKPNWIVSVSSGAVYKNGNNQTLELENNLELNPYGYLKHLEEKTIRDTAKEINANYVIGRLWGATGSDIQNYEPYAIGDFISSALSGNKITVKSTSNIKRNFVDSRQFMTILTKEAILGSNLTVDSFGTEITIRELAKKVCEQFPGSQVSLPPNYEPDKSDNYIPLNQDFLQLFEKWRIHRKTIEEQIRDTIVGIEILLRQEKN